MKSYLAWLQLQHPIARTNKSGRTKLLSASAGLPHSLRRFDIFHGHGLPFAHWDTTVDPMLMRNDIRNTWGIVCVKIAFFSAQNHSGSL